MNRINQMFEKHKSENKKSLISFLMAGDQGLDHTKKMCHLLKDSGTDLLEIGVPFSDPLADGKTNQEAAKRALQNNIDVSDILQLVKEIRSEGFDLPIVLFSYLNPVFQYGYKRIAKECRDSGVDGLLLVDLPPEEADGYVKAMDKENIKAVFLASPTTSRERLKKIDRLSSGFVYYVSRTGVTGEKAELSSSLNSELEIVKDNIKSPLVVGFGISTGEQAKVVSENCDGIVVGSAIVKRIPEAIDASGINKLKEFVSSLSNAIN